MTINIGLAGFRHRCIPGIVALLSVLCSVPLLAQVGKSGLTGTVTDVSGALVPNVKITAKNEATNLTWSAVTSTPGAYFIQDLPAGRYTITAEAPGFQRSVVQNLVTEVDRV